MQTNAFLSHTGIWNFDDEVVTKLKLATLLCDKIVHSGIGEPLLFAECTRAHSGESALSRIAKAQIAQSWCRVDPVIIPSYERWLSESKGLINALINSPASLKLATTHSLLGSGFSPRDDYDAYKTQAYIIAEISYWKKYFGDSLFIGHSLADSALQRLSAPMVDLSELQEALSPIPSTLPISWNDIFDLRTSPYYENFRAKISELRIANDKKNLRHHFQEGLESIAKEVAPSVPRATTLAVLSNLPIPGNPFHIGQSLLEVRDQWKMAKHHGWVFFICQAREKANSNIASNQQNK